MRTLVIEPNHGGHYLQWAGLLATALARAGAEVTLATSIAAEGSACFREHICPLQDNFTVDAWLPNRAGNSTWSHATGGIAFLEEGLRRTKAKRIYLPTADGLAQMLAITRLTGTNPVPKSVALEGLLMNGAVAHPAENLTSRLRDRLSYELAKSANWDRFYHLNPFVGDCDTLSRMPHGKRVLRMPEPVEPPSTLTKKEARARFGLPAEGQYTGMVGGINERKGADLAIQGFTNARLPSSSRLLLFGPFTDAVKALAIAKQHEPEFRNRIFVQDRLLSDEDLGIALRALDLPLLPYPSNVSSSGIATRATAAQRPILINGGGWGQKMIDLFDLGWTLENSTKESIARALELHLEESIDWRLPKAAIRLVAYNTIPNFMHHWTAGLKTAQGQPISPELRTWAWATGTQK